MRKLVRKLPFKPLGLVRTVAWKEVLYVGIPLLIAGFIALWVAEKYVKPSPPKKVVMATGPEGSAYHWFGGEYAKRLARDGITVETIVTAGARENYRLIRNEDGSRHVDVALVRGGIGEEEEAPHLVSLGAVGYEALWVFCRGKATLDDLPGLRGKSIAIGSKGAGTRRLVRGMLKANGIEEDDFRAVDLGGIEAAEALITGDVDCAFLFEPPESGILKALFYSDAAQLVDFSRRADAYTKRLPFLRKVVLPEGAIEMAENRPEKPVTLLAAETQLLAHEDLHPAIQMLLLQAATRIHGGVGLFNDERQFPTRHVLEFPLSDDADRFYTSGRPFLQRYLPFWLANLADRALVFLLPALAIVFPLVRILPPLYAWSMRRRIYRWYGELMYIENETRRTLTEGETREFGDRLEWIEQEVNALHIPLAFANQVYLLRQHIDFVQQKLEQMSAAPIATGPDAVAAVPEGKH
ncbi:MAG: ABC transporter substrate-binding protein [Burkholderiales bacterium]|nr:ABC transporter substrate-binding protein [Burkholderiales bacterium]